MPAPTKKADTQALAAAAPETLSEALLVFQRNLPRVGKTKTARIVSSKGSYSYRYADLSDVIDVALPLLNDLGLFFIVAPVRFDDGSYAAKGILTHAPSDMSIEGWLPLRAGTPQELGSALTYARRYLLTTMTGIVAEEDDDAQTAIAGQDAETEAEAEALRQQAALNQSRQGAFDRWVAAGNAPDRNVFMAQVEATFALPFLEVTVEQLGRFPE